MKTNEPALGLFEDCIGEVYYHYGGVMSSYWASPNYWPDATLVFHPAGCSYSDYSGSTVERSNAEVLMNRYGHMNCVVRQTGGYGTTAFVIVPGRAIWDDADELNELIEDLDCIANYFILDEEHLSALEAEVLEGNWESWIRADLERELERETGLDDIDLTIDVLYELLEHTGEVPIFENPNTVYVDIKRITTGYQARYCI